MFFNKNKKKEASMISGNDVIFILEMAVDAIDQYQIEYEFDFQFHGASHVAGIGYDRKKAPRKGVDKKLLYFYIDADSYPKLEEFKEKASLSGHLLKTIGCEIEVVPELAEAVKNRDIESNEQSTWYGESGIFR